MKDWISNKKNLPIVVAVSVVVVIVAVGLFLLEMGILPGFGKAVATAPPMSGPNSVRGAGSAPPVGPNVAVRPGAPGAKPVAGVPAGARPGMKPGAGGKVAVAGAKPLAKPVAAPKPKVVAAKPAAPAAAVAPVQRMALAGGPFANARPDPFRPGFNLASLTPVEQVVITPPSLTNVGLPALTAAVTGGFQPQYQQGQGQNGQGAMPRLIGVIKTNGGASVMVDSVDTPLVAGDALPNGVGTITSIEADHMTVKTPGGQIVQVYINANPTPTAGGYNGGQQPNPYNGGQQQPNPYNGGQPQQQNPYQRLRNE